MKTIESAGLSDIGKKRKDNEDALFVDDDMGLYVVADGMGGHRAGEVASKMVVESIRNYIRSAREGRSATDSEIADQTLSSAANLVLAGIALSNKVVYDAAQSNLNYHGMGSTVSILYVNDGTLVAANVGDSPIFLIHKGQIESLAVTHTVMAEHMAANPGTTDQIDPAYNHVLTRAIGAESTVKADICEVPYFSGDKLVISSDGLTDLVTPEEILASVTAHPPAAACRALVQMANDRGGTDNITVVVIYVGSKSDGSDRLKDWVLRASHKLFGKYWRKNPERVKGLHNADSDAKIQEE